jgi:hypothetical protein
MKMRAALWSAAAKLPLFLPEVCFRPLCHGHPGHPSADGRAGCPWHASVLTRHAALRVKRTATNNKGWRRAKRQLRGRTPKRLYGEHTLDKIFRMRVNPKPETFNDE